MNVSSAQLPRARRRAGQLDAKRAWHAMALDHILFDWHAGQRRRGASGAHPGSAPVHRYRVHKFLARVGAEPHTRRGEEWHGGACSGQTAWLGTALAWARAQSGVVKTYAAPLAGSPLSAASPSIVMAPESSPVAPTTTALDRTAMLIPKQSLRSAFGAFR